MRHEPTDVEAALWKLLRARGLAGFKFRRQYSCGPFVLDFFCACRHLAVELDGGQHFQPRAQAYDARRTEYLAERGIKVIRFPNDVVLYETESVLAAIAAALDIAA